MAAATAHTAPAGDQGSVDGILLLTTALLLCFGLVMVYSSSAVYALKQHDQGAHYLLFHGARALVGLVALCVVARVSGSCLARHCGWLFAGSVLLCVAVLIPGVGRLAGGARRWLGVGALSLQPSELAKLAVVVTLAALLARAERSGEVRMRTLLLSVSVAQVPVALILAEPDLGTALVIELLVAILVFAAGLRLRVLLALGFAALPVFYHLVVGTPFRQRRLMSYIDPWNYRQTAGYQVTEALISIGSGGIQGVGLGESKHKLFFLPEAHTDFVYAIVAEELGLIGAVLLLLAFAVLSWRGIVIAMRALTPFDRFLALGMTCLIGVPAVFNTCVVTGLLPTKGLPLPFVSYGGSNVVAALAAIGFVLRVDRDNRHGAGVGAGGVG